MRIFTEEHRTELLDTRRIRMHISLAWPCMQPTKAVTTKEPQLRVYSDKYLQNAAYVRLKDITLGYTLPKTLCSKIGFSSIRVYVSGTNLLTFSPLYKHNEDRTVDPEQLGDGNAYPFSKTFAFGFDFKF